MDSRINKLANTLLQHSIGLMSGEKVYIDYCGSDADGLIQAIIRGIYEIGGIPFLHCTNSKFEREILMNCTEK